MRTPPPRGPVSEQVARALASHPDDTLFPDVELPADPDALVDSIMDEDLQLSLWMLYEQSYRGFEDAYDHEWEPAALAVRRRLETAFELTLRRATAGYVRAAGAEGPALVTQLEGLVAHFDGPGLASFLQRRATRDQVLEFLAVRSLYHLKESDPHAFVMARIDGRAKVALAELQYDEFGAGRPERLHSRLYRDALDAAGLDPTYGAYVNRTPATALAVNNVMSLFALQRRLRGAALGHLAAFEATSSVPCRRIAAGIERVGLPATTADYFHEHVEADAAHEQIAIRDICGALVEDQPAEHAEVLFGAAACLHLDALSGAESLAAWDGQDHELAS